MGSSDQTVCGYIAIVGRPNVGKSTLLNAFLGRKISITSRKPQTTRHRILGIKTLSDTQMIFVDTPGLHQDGENLMNRYMNHTASRALSDVNCVLWVVDATLWTDDDTMVCEKLNKISQPILLVINKTDKLENQDDLLPLIEKLAKRAPRATIVPISAKKQFNLDELEKCIKVYLPHNPFFFAPEQLTDRSEHFLIAEFIREKLVRNLGQELPYATMVAIDSFTEQKKVLHIRATIWVEREGQKGIVIGRGGEMLKRIGQQSRLMIEKFFDQKVFLQLWVKVKESWSEDERILKSHLS